MVKTTTDINLDATDMKVYGTDMEGIFETGSFVYTSQCRNRGQAPRERKNLCVVSYEGGYSINLIPRRYTSNIED